MTTKTALIAALLALALAGCASAPFGQPACDTPVCHATVTVNDCRISVDPYELHVKAGNKNSQIHWNLSSQGYAFTADGIFLKGNTGGELHSPELANPSLFKLKNKNSYPGTYHYGIKVTRDGMPCPPLDPPIVNDM